MSAPERRDGKPRLVVELEQDEAHSLFDDAYLGGCIRRALDMAPRSSAEDYSSGLAKLLKAIVIEEGPGGSFYVTGLSRPTLVK